MRTISGYMLTEPTNAEEFRKWAHSNTPFERASANPAFSQVVVASGRRTIYTVGQVVAIDERGALVGAGDLAEQQHRRCEML